MTNNIIELLHKVKSKKEGYKAVTTPLDPAAASIWCIIRYLNQSKSTAHHMYHLPYSYINNQSKIKLLILSNFQALTWCNWELHSFGILSFITGSCRPKFWDMQWPHLQGSMVKQTTGWLTHDNEVTAVSKH